MPSCLQQVRTGNLGHKSEIGSRSVCSEHLQKSSTLLLLQSWTSSTWLLSYSSHVTSPMEGQLRYASYQYTTSHQKVYTSNLKRVTIAKTFFLVLGRREKETLVKFYNCLGCGCYQTRSKEESTTGKRIKYATEVPVPLTSVVWTFTNTTNHKKSTPLPQ